MAIPILNFWKDYYNNPDEGLGSSYERIILNKLLEKVVTDFNINTVLEVPSFGFTGLSGINSMHLAKIGLETTIIDNNQERIELSEKIWNDTLGHSNFKYLDHFCELPFNENRFDFTWNFSALWFVKDLEIFIREICRVSEKAIMLCVPNRKGIGYLNQKYTGKKDLQKYLTEDNIIPNNFISEMSKNNWSLFNSDYIDCPPWPDIGMAKEDFLRKFGMDFLISSKQKTKKTPITILDFYKDKDINFEKKMMKYSYFEKYAPTFFKMIWAHHRFFLFLPND